MKSAFKLFLYISFILFGNLYLFSSLSIANEETKGDLENKIDINYLKKISRSDYILGSGDSLSIAVSPLVYPELVSNSTIDGEGFITLPNIGSVYVEGLTVNEMNFLLNKSYKEYVNFPNVETRISNYRPLKVIVKGEVNDPGIQTLKGSMKLLGDPSSVMIKKDFVSEPPTPEMQNNKLSEDINYYFPTVFDAIRSAGGLTNFSDLSNIQVIRKDTLSNGGGNISTNLDFINSDINTPNIRIYDDDIIIVKKVEFPINNSITNVIRSDLNPKYIRVIVTGKVYNPGEKVLLSASTLNDAIDISGGTKTLRGPIKYLSFSNKGVIEKRTIRYKKRNKRGSVNNPILKNGDIVFVGTSLFSNTAEAITEITSPFQGIYSTYRLIELITD